MNDKQLVAQYKRSKTVPEGKTYADIYAAAKRIGKPFRGRPPGKLRAARNVRAVDPAGASRTGTVTLSDVESHIVWTNLGDPVELAAQRTALRDLAASYRTAATKIDAALAALNGRASK